MLPTVVYCNISLFKNTSHYNTVALLFSNPRDSARLSSAPQLAVVQLSDCHRTRRTRRENLMKAFWLRFSTVKVYEFMESSPGMHEIKYR